MKPGHQATVLLLMSQKNSGRFESALAPLDVDVICARDLCEARDYVRAGRGIDVVVTDVTVPDGNWSDVLRCVVDSGGDAAVVVCSPEPDEHLWSEVLWRGGYDVLPQSFRPEEARRVVEGAKRTSYPATWKSPRRKQVTQEKARAAASASH